MHVIAIFQWFDKVVIGCKCSQWIALTWISLPIFLDSDCNQVRLNISGVALWIILNNFLNLVYFGAKGIADVWNIVIVLSE